MPNDNDLKAIIDPPLKATDKIKDKTTSMRSGIKIFVKASSAALSDILPIFKEIKRLAKDASITIIGMHKTDR